LESLRSGDFGSCPQQTIDEYRANCHAVFPLALAFAPEIPNGVIDKKTLGIGSEDKAVSEQCCLDEESASPAGMATNELSDGITA
jgi:hypothetical protein